MSKSRQNEKKPAKYEDFHSEEEERDDSRTKSRIQSKSSRDVDAKRSTRRRRDSSEDSSDGSDSPRSSARRDGVKKHKEVKSSKSEKPRRDRDSDEERKPKSDRDRERERERDRDKGYNRRRDDDREPRREREDRDRPSRNEDRGEPTREERRLKSRENSELNKDKIIDRNERDDDRNYGRDLRDNRIEMPRNDRDRNERRLPMPMPMPMSMPLPRNSPSDSRNERPHDLGERSGGERKMERSRDSPARFEKKPSDGWAKDRNDDDMCSECDEPGHHSDTCFLKTSMVQSTHNSLYMGDANYDEDDIPEGESKENYMFAQDKKREELLFNSGALAGIDFSNYEKFKVEVEGKSIPNPLDTFQSVRWSPVIENAITLYGWRVPTPVQKYALPAAINHYDVIASAQTGSGKTACYLMPSIRYLLQTPFEKNSTIGYKMMSLPRVLIVAPVRELAQQINKEALKLSYRSSLKSVCVFGGSGYRDQLEGLKKGCDILVATPGRLKDMVEKGHIGLNQVRFLILDEADRMLDMGFKDDIANIISLCPPSKTGPEDKDGRQTLMFSATFPKDIQIFAMEYLREDHVFIQVGRVGSTTELITQTIEYVEDFDKSARLVELLETIPGKTLVFCQTKHDCDRLERDIRRRGIRCMAFHGGKTQQSREIALSKFGSGQLRVIFATDVASRGLDVADVKHVIIYDLPTHVDDYVHRIGRTGRAGNKGLATSLYNAKNSNIARELKDILAESNQVIPQFIEDDSAHSTGSTYRTGSRAKSESSFVNSFAQRSGGGDRSGGGGGYGNKSAGGGTYGGERSGGGGGGAQQRGGDWTCGKCGSNNFARNNQCFRRDCGAARPASPNGGGGGYGDRQPAGGGYGDRQPAGGPSWGDAGGGGYGDRQPAGGSSWGGRGGDSWGSAVPQPSPSNDQWGNNTAISQAGGSAGWD